jgi:hypothetical protein
MRTATRHLTGEIDSAKLPRLREAEIAANGRRIFFLMSFLFVAAYRENVVG